MEWHHWPIDTETLLGFHERAFEGSGGDSPRDRPPPDQTGRHLRLSGEAEFNGAFHGYPQRRGFKPWVRRKSDPETKGKIEALIRYVKRGFLPSRSFESMEDLDGQWRRWPETVGDAKLHETTGVTPLRLWRRRKGVSSRLPRACSGERPPSGSSGPHSEGLIGSWVTVTASLRRTTAVPELKSG